jgi:uncharacterized protein
VRKSLITKIQKELENSLNALENHDIFYFTRNFPTKEHWRILHQYQDKLSYFDIETSGLSFYDSEISVISCFHDEQMNTYINGENLDDFLDILQEIELLVSFNGNSFDVPFVQESFNIPTFPCPHIDLRWICFHKGLKGTLKQIEVDCGVYRDHSIQGVDGYEAVLLWEKWKRFSIEKALDKLIEYCEADVYALQEVTKEVLLR